ncbi:MAG: DNA primase [Candidatus Melainabacteria bacterium]
MSTPVTFQDAADRVKDALDIVDVVQRHVPLKKAGRNFTGLCPFHNDKHPSMNVNRERNIFKCFACGEGGDALTFLMKIERRTYGEIIRELAREQGIEIKEDGQYKAPSPVEAQEKDAVIALNEAALTWFRRNLHPTCQEGQSVRAYLAGRDLPASVLDAFELGYALPGWENLKNQLLAEFPAAQANPVLLETAGLVTMKEGGQSYYDRFRNRLIIPIRDDQGRCVAFGGRALSDADNPKYLNSPETPVYQKNRVLYGLFQARDAIRQTKTALVMEGYFDVIRAHAMGIRQAVGVCGTALTEQHVKLLNRLGVETLYLAFDSDAAGVKAALNALTVLKPFTDRLGTPQGGGFQVKVLSIPSGKDPDDYLAGFETEEDAQAAMAALMDASPAGLAFQCQQAIAGLDTHTLEGRLTACRQLTPVLCDIASPVVRSEYTQRMAERVGVAPETLGEELRRYRQLQPGGRGGNKSLQESGASRAISEGFRRSFKGQKQWGGSSKNRAPLTPRLTDNMHELRQALFPNHVQSERTLVKLMLLNMPCCRMMIGHLAAIAETRPIVLTDAVLQAILEGIRSVFPESDPDPRLQSIGDVIQALMQRFADQPTLQQTLATLALTADDLMESYGFSALSPAEQQQKVMQEAQKCCDILHRHHERQTLQQLNRQARDLETGTGADTSQPVLLQYEIRDRIHQHTPPTPPVNR